MSEPRDFIHRQNLDETTDSICLRCMETVATVQNPKGIEKLEKEHACDPFSVERFRAVREAYLKSVAVGKNE